MKIKLYSLIVLLFISSFAIGCSKETVRGDEPPMPKITLVDDKKAEIPVAIGSYAWKSEVDKIGPEELLREYKTVILPRNSKIEIKFDYKPNPSSITIRKRDANGGIIIEKKLNDNIFAVSDKVGNHTYEIDAKWGEKGREVKAQAMYYFKVEIK